MDNTSQFIQDLVFSGGRFISTGEGIDTSQRGWELRVKVMELHNSHTIREIAHRVRRGQEGRVREDGSAGDFPFGYESYYLNADWADNRDLRGPKPKKGLRICEEEANWVRQVFSWFDEGRSISWIAKTLTRQGVHKGRRASTCGWHAQQVRRMLSNGKYVGQWRWGATTTLRDSQGRKKQIALPAHEHVVRERPDLRIIEQPIWEKVQCRLAELHAAFGFKEGQRPRGPKPNPHEVYPRSLLSGLLVCGKCGTKLWLTGSGRSRHYACPAHRNDLCTMAAQVPASRAEQALTQFLTDMLSTWPDWLGDLYERVRQLVSDAAAEAPYQQDQDFKQLMEVKRKEKNLIDALADGRLTSAAVQQHLKELEMEAEQLQRRVDSYQQLHQVDLPEDHLLADELREWTMGLGEDTILAARVLRQAVGTVAAHAIVAAGKRRGYIQLRFRINGWETLQAVLGGRIPQSLKQYPIPDDGNTLGQSMEFTLDLGQPTSMDYWAPKIAAWRAQGVKWKEIVQRTSLDLNRVFIAWKRHTENQGEEENWG